jgi:beta-phosphoglucomutase-like phosphatase (HAD superfamily)
MNKYRSFIFDLTGTLIDFGGQTHTTAIYRAFRNNNINISENIVKLPKYYDINIAMRVKNICKYFNCMDKVKPVLNDVNSEIIKLNKDKYYTAPILGAFDTIDYLKKNGYKIGIISNYNNSILKHIDYDVFIKYNKINPWISFEVLEKLNIEPHKCIKIGEPYMNIYGGFSLQMDTINIIDSSIEMSYDEETFDDLSDEIKYIKRQNIISKYNNNYMHSINDFNLFIKNILYYNGKSDNK